MGRLLTAMVTLTVQGSKLGWTGGPSLPKIPSDHRYTRCGGPVVYQKVLAFLLQLAVNDTNNVSYVQ